MLYAHGKWASSEWFISEVCQMGIRAYGLVLASSATKTHKKWSNSGDEERNKMAFAMFKHLNCVRLGKTSLYFYQTNVRRCRWHQLMETQTKRGGCDKNETEKRRINIWCHAIHLTSAGKVATCAQPAPTWAIIIETFIRNSKNYERWVNMCSTLYAHPWKGNKTQARAPLVWRMFSKSQTVADAVITRIVDNVSSNVYS